MERRVEISQVSLFDPDRSLISSAALEAPAAGTESGTYAFDFWGWIAARRPVSAVELSHPGARPARVPLDIARPDIAKVHPELADGELQGFQAKISSLRFPPDFEARVEAVFENDERVALGEFRGKRARLRSTFEPRLRPLVVTTLGRTGTTFLMLLLREHPQVVVYRPFEYEPRVLGYWMDLLASLSQPQSYKRQLLSPAERRDGWPLGLEPPFPRRDAPEAGIEETIGAEGIEELAAFCQRRIDSVYLRIASTAAAAPVYFAEKYGPHWIIPLTWELYPKAREVIVVRDFRDVVCSILAFNSKRGLVSFGRQRVETDEQFVGFLAGPVERLLQSWYSRKAEAHLVRYEDLVLAPHETLERLLSYLDLDAGGDLIDAMLEASSRTSPEMEQHRTTPEPAASVGRWRRDLSPELQRACEEAFGQALEEFGYLTEPART